LCVSKLKHMEKAIFVELGIYYILESKAQHKNVVVKFRSERQFDDVNDSGFEYLIRWFLQFIPEDAEFDIVEPVRYIPDDQVTTYLTIPPEYEKFHLHYDEE